MAGVAEQPGHRQSNSHILALLSLKILLLAFFILLNALATFEEKRSAAVVDSVREAFRGAIPSVVSLPPAPLSQDNHEGADSLVKSLARLFGDSLPLQEQSDIPGAQTLKVDLPVSEVFGEEWRGLAPKGVETLRSIAEVLKDPRFSQLGYRVDVLYGLRSSDSGLQRHRGALARAGVLVRQLEGLGLQSDHLSTGFLPSFPDHIRLLFTIQTQKPPKDGKAGDQGKGS